MQKLETLYTESPSGKFRFMDWDHQTKFLTILSVSEDGDQYIGELDCGTKIKVDKLSDFWMNYQKGDEQDCARAI